MTEEVSVDLVYDPYRIFEGKGERVSSLMQELAAFHVIGDLLRQINDPATRRRLTYILDSSAWEHFRSLRSVKGVRLRKYTPRGEVQSLFNAEPPSWLTDELVVSWKLLQRRGPTTILQNDWAATLAEWLLTGITDVSSMMDWLVVAASVNEVPEPLAAAPVVEWLSEQLRSLAQREIPLPEVAADFAELLREDACPVSFAQEWLRRRALLPLIRPAIERHLSLPGLRSESPQDLARASYIPLPFPLPAPIHAEVSRHMCQAVRIAQIERPDTFEQVVTSLNALWDGVAEELDRWLQVKPRGMTDGAASHLASLPGYSKSETAQRLVRLYAPPPQVARWTDLDDSFGQWVNAYAGYIERLFYQRKLPPSGDDPADPFSKWVKSNPTVFFNHPEKGYLCVAGMVQRALQEGRSVILILVDALAIHVAEAALAAFESELGVPPTRLLYCFTPVPTITEVCKEAILGGELPQRCHGNLKQTLLRRYDLTSEQLQLAAHWQDAERARVTRQVRLLVYRDNRLDEQLSTFTSYRALRESFVPLIGSVARFVRQWTEEFRHWHGTPPLVVLTGDHGFTFGPREAADGTFGGGDGGHRCIALGEGRPEDSKLRDESLTFLDREMFHLRSNYLVARGRVTGQGTMSDWSLSHGGLLPEEVIVPVIEWYGDQEALPFPDIAVPSGVARDRGQWILTLHLQNNHPVQTNGGRIRVTLAGEGTGPATQYQALRPGTMQALSLEVPGQDLPNNQEVVFEVTLTPRGTDVPLPDLVRHLQVARARQFVERTRDQAAFEDMF